MRISDNIHNVLFINALGGGNASLGHFFVRIPLAFLCSLFCLSGCEKVVIDEGETPFFSVSPDSTLWHQIQGTWKVTGEYRSDFGQFVAPWEGTFCDIQGDTITKYTYCIDYKIGKTDGKTYVKSVDFVVRMQFFASDSIYIEGSRAAFMYVPSSSQLTIRGPDYGFIMVREE
ncbi:MAG: hypothetical protein ACI3Y0_04815 [Prevotella sp.]